MWGSLRLRWWSGDMTLFDDTMRGQTHRHAHRVDQIESICTIVYAQNALYAMYARCFVDHHHSLTGNSPFFFFSPSHRSIHAFIRSRLFALPTLTVGITRPMRRAQQNMVSSRKELCSL